MQASQRTEYNHALAYATERADELDKPLVVFFGITDSYPEANERHYRFMLEGLREVHAALEDGGVRMVLRLCSPETGVAAIAKRAALVVVDRGYLAVQRKWRRSAAARITCPLVEVESDVVVPAGAASTKEEYSAATFRPKVWKHLYDYLHPLRIRPPKRPSLGLEFDGVDPADIDRVLERLAIDRSVEPAPRLRGGTSRAKRLLGRFIASKLDRFHELRNDPSRDYCSHMSPYLHFGQISPVYIALRVMDTRSPGQEAYIEELVVRRELAVNYVTYNRGYHSFDALPEWSRKTLDAHRRDRREATYSRTRFERAQTHDPYWNAAQDEMRLTGKMHGYMRMYWGKKILEWSEDPRRAFKTAIYLNNKYELDGRDPNGYAGVAWCFGKHDRPWAKRPIFGSVRYMNDRGLRRKFDIDAYCSRIERLRRAARGGG
jgi:deoxyribodipyrimidine photo-lyase